MHARLVADLDQPVEIGEQRPAALDDLVLRLPAEIGIVEIEDIVILDLRLRRMMTAMRFHQA